MAIARHTFARLNTDQDPSAKGLGEFDAATNIALGDGNVRPQTGNILVPYTLPVTPLPPGVVQERVRRVTKDAFYYSVTALPADRTVTTDYYYVLATGSLPYPHPDSTYLPLERIAPASGPVYYRPVAGAAAVDYRTAFVLIPTPPLPNYVVISSLLAVTANELAWVQRADAPPAPLPFSRSLGGFADGATGTAIELLYNSLDAHRLIRYNPQGNNGAGSRTTLLEWSGLNFSPTLVPQGGVLDGVLVYLGADGYLRSVNLARAAAGYYTPALLAANSFALHTVKPPPPTAPEPAFSFATTTLRIIQDKAYQFALRWRYLDGEVSVLSPYSEWMDVTDSPSTTTRTAISLFLPATPPIVAEVEVLVRQATTATEWQVAEVLRPVNGVVPRTIYFVGLVTGQSLTAAEANRPFESEWPGAAAVVADDRVFKSDLTEGYPTPAPAFRATLQTAASLDGRTLHENSNYRVVMQFYDAQGKPFGCSAPRTVYVPPRGLLGGGQYIGVELLTTASGQHAEIPENAYFYQFLVAPNDQVRQFRQGKAADTLGYLGQLRTASADGSVKEQPHLRDFNLAHEKLWVDIGNWPAAGLGYVWRPGSGDILRFVPDNREFVITGQTGDYVEVAWNSKPSGEGDGLIEIYTPTTSPSEVYYERGPRFPVLRDATGRRTYSTTQTTLPGDCFLVGLKFPVLVDDGTYQANPAQNKRYNPATVTTTVESPVPLYRLVRHTTTTTTVANTNIFSGPLAAEMARRLEADLAARGKTGTTTAAVAADAEAARWLDMSYGGRPGLVVPAALQQVRRPALLRFSEKKVAGTQLNGLSQWDALSQYDELPQELGAVTRLSAAAQAQTDTRIILVNQEKGEASLSLGRGQIQTADDQVLLTVSKDVIGSHNPLRGGCGCQHPASVVAYAGKVFFWSQARQELLRYDRNGLVPLGETYKARERLESVARQYTGANVRGCVDPARKEYWLTFEPVGALPGATLVYNEDREAWADALSAVPEAGMGVDTELITWKAGALWRHSPGAAQATFYGVYTAPSLTFTVGQQPGARQFKDVAIESASLWPPTALLTDTGLASRTLRHWFTWREGIWRAGFRRAENTPGFPTVYHALDNGDVLIGTRLTVTLTAPLAALPLTACSASFLPRSGQQMGV